jgi:ribosomal protein S18 acetylase RimI-like enzyme
MEKYTVYIDKNIKAAEIVDLYISAGWGKAVDYKESSLQILIRNTSSFVYARNEQGLLIGFVRILSDFVITTYVTEIIVRPDYQKNGVGTELMEKVKFIFKNTGIYFDTLKGVEKFAEKCGFTRRDNMTVFAKRFV